MMYDIFLTHDWRQNSECSRIASVLDSAFGLNWRNFGTPWYDPRIVLSSAEGAEIVRGQMEKQLAGTKLVVFLPIVYLESSRGREWTGYAVEIARREHIPVFGILPASGTVPPDVLALADCWGLPADLIAAVSAGEK